MNLFHITVLTASLATALLAGATSPIVLTPEQFGASAQAEDNARAFHQMIAAAVAIDGPVEISLTPNALYRIGASKGKEYALEISNAQELVFNGQGATLVFTNPLLGGICVQNSRAVILKNFFVDYDPLPYTQGVITAIDLDEYWFEYKIDEGHTEPDSPLFEGAQNQSLLTIQERSDGGKQYGPTVMTPEKSVSLGDRKWRIYPKRADRGYTDPLKTSGMTTGDIVIHSSRNYAQAISTQYCDTIILENITIYASPSLGFYPRGNKNEIIRDCHIAVKDGRLFSINADGIHMRGSRGNVLIENCTFEGGGDDAINVHSSAIPVIAHPKPNQVLTQKHTYSVRPGDRLEGILSKDVTSLGIATILAVEDKREAWLITLDRDLQLPDLADANNQQLNVHGLPKTLVNLYNLDESAAPFIIRNCTFNDFRGRGILISALDGTIENNLFRVREGWGIVMHYESTRWAEGPITRNLVIRNNEFQWRDNARHAAIRSNITAGDRISPPQSAFSQITIENNTFGGWSDPLYLHFMDNPQLKDNKTSEARPK